MRIDEEKLIALLAERTGKDAGEMQEQLRLLKERLGKVKETGEPFEIAHFGVFTRQEDTLHFEPKEQLKTEINQKYAGMRPIELMEAFKEAGADLPVEEVPPELVTAEEEETESEEREPVAADAPEEEAEKVETKPPAQPEKTPVPTAEEKAEKKSPKKSKEKAYKTPEFHRDRRKRSGAGVIIAIAAVIIIVLAGGWILYTSGALNSGTKKNMATDTSNVNSKNTVSAAVPADSMQGSASQRDTLGEQNGAGNVSTRKQTKLKYGLKGTTVDSLQNAYTIVIHSFRLKSTVQEIADSLQQKGYRTVLFERGVNDVSRWRLGLGQFQDIESAEDAAKTLTAPYKSNHFITRL